MCLESFQVSEADYQVKMVNREVEIVRDGKKYLEEVMGIVEDEEFNRERKRRLRDLKQRGYRQGKTETVRSCEDLIDEDYNTVWCGTQVTQD